MGARLALPVALLHAAAFLLGYWLPKVLGFNEKTNRTVSIETGMQSAALGFLLAQQHFADPLVAVPSAVRFISGNLICACNCDRVLLPRPILYVFKPLSSKLPAGSSFAMRLVSTRCVHR